MSSIGRPSRVWSNRALPVPGITQKYGRFRSERIERVGRRFCTRGDYLHGVARIRCTNPDCGYCRDRLRFLRAERPKAFCRLHSDRSAPRDSTYGPHAVGGGRQLMSGMIVAHQTYGDVLRFNPHFHAIVLEGGSSGVANRARAQRGFRSDSTGIPLAVTSVRPPRAGAPPPPRTRRSRRRRYATLPRRGCAGSGRGRRS